MPMKNPPHPGLSVRHDCLEPLGLTVTQAAGMLGVNRKQLSDIVNGHAEISPEMAIRLHKAFGGGSSTWYRLQAAYDLAQAMKKTDRIKIERPAADGREGEDSCVVENSQDRTSDGGCRSGYRRPDAARCGCAAGQGGSQPYPGRRPL